MGNINIQIESINNRNSYTIIGVVIIAKSLSIM